MALKITDQILEEIKERIDIVELIGERVPLKRAGTSYKGCCPFHHEKTPSFNVNAEKRFYHCFGCGESGDIFTFLMKQDGLTFTDAVKRLADKAGIELEEGGDEKSRLRSRLYALHAELAVFYQRCLNQTKEAVYARAYLTSRKLPEEVVKSFGIGYAPARARNATLRWGAKYGYSVEELTAAGIIAPSKHSGRAGEYYDRFKGRIMFPICDRQGRVVAFSGRILDPKSHPAKYVNSPETEIFIKSRTLYGLDKAAAKIVKHPRREAIVCEGQIDVIRCHACGFETAVASQGTAFTKEHVSLLKKCADSVILLFDGDTAGRKAALRTGALFVEAEMPVRVAPLPPGEDPDSLLRDRGPKAMEELLDSAASITAFQIETLRAGEPNPETIDATNRISRAVLEMLAPCPGAVLRTRLLQEAAELLHLPLSAMEDDLARVQENQRHHSSYSTAAKRSEPPLPKELPPSELAPLEDESFPQEFEVVEEPFVEDECPAGIPPPQTEYLLCELLMECEHDAAVLEFVRTYLPLQLLTHPFTHGFVETILTEFSSGEDLLASFCSGLPAQWQSLMGRLIANDQKMMSAREISPVEAARDFVVSLWVGYLKTLRGGLSSESTPENDAQRLRLSCLIKTFESAPWDRVSALILQQRPLLFP